ncbi:MAG: hypothetical protein WC529_06070 [Candidatus Margulisiibacteriota bacterium]
MELFNIICVAAGICLFISSITIFWTSWNIFGRERFTGWWLTLGVLVAFFLLGYLFFELYLINGWVLIDLKSLVAQVFFWGAVFVLVCARLFFLTNRQLDEGVKELQQLKFELEKKVLDRTQQLEAAKLESEKKVVERTRELYEEKLSLESKVQERTAELAKKVAELQEFYDLTVGREIKMMELEDEMERIKAVPPQKPDN